MDAAARRLAARRLSDLAEQRYRAAGDLSDQLFRKTRALPPGLTQRAARREWYESLAALSDLAAAWVTSLRAERRPPCAAPVPEGCRTCGVPLSGPQACTANPDLCLACEAQGGF